MQAYGLWGGHAACQRVVLRILAKTAELGVTCAQDIEANLMKQDVARAALRAAHNAPAALAKAMEMNDAALTRRRGRMMLPAPQVRCRVCGLRGVQSVFLFVLVHH